VVICQSPRSDCTCLRPYQQPIGNYRPHTHMTMPISFPNRRMKVDGLQPRGIRPAGCLRKGCNDKPRGTNTGQGQSGHHAAGADGSLPR
jgi:hypothetical protein